MVCWPATLCASPCQLSLTKCPSAAGATLPLLPVPSRQWQHLHATLQLKAACQRVSNVEAARELASELLSEPSLASVDIGAAGSGASFGGILHPPTLGELATRLHRAGSRNKRRRESPVRVAPISGSRESGPIRPEEDNQFGHKLDGCFGRDGSSCPLGLEVRTSSEAFREFPTWKAP